MWVHIKQKKRAFFTHIRSWLSPLIQLTKTEFGDWNLVLLNWHLAASDFMCSTSSSFLPRLSNISRRSSSDLIIRIQWPTMVDNSVQFGPATEKVILLLWSCANWRRLKASHWLLRGLRWSSKQASYSVLRLAARTGWAVWTKHRKTEAA